MKKALFLWLFLLVMGAVMVFGSMPLMLKVKVQMANVRQEPDPNSAIITQVAKGTELVAKARAGNWFEISMLDKSGKTMSAFIHVNTVDVVSGDREQALAQDEEIRPEKPAEKEKPAPARPEPRPERVLRPAPRMVKSGGIKLIGGLNFNRFIFSDQLPPQLTQKSQMGFTGGIGFESGGSGLGIELDILISKGGSSFATDADNKFVIDGFGIYLPLLLKIRLMPGSGPYLLAGGSAGYLLSQSVKIVSPAGTIEEDISDEVNRLYYGLVFGGGFEMAMESMSLLFEFRYDLGLANWIKEADPGDYARSRAISLLLGIRF